MSIPTAAVAAVLVLVLGLAPTLANAGQNHRHHLAQHKSHHGHIARAPAPRYTTPADAEDLDTAPGAALRAQARANQAAPGVTNELAPDNLATASGGPSGGVPGFSAH